LFKSIYKPGEYQIHGTPYRLRGAVIPRKADFAEDLEKKKKEESPDEKLARAKEELVAIEKLVEAKQEELKLIQDECAETMLKAEEDAKNLLADAEKKAVEISEEAKKRGYDEGYEKGYFEGIAKAKAEIEQKYSQLLATMKSLSETALLEKQKLIKSAENDILDLSVEIAKKVVKHELKTDNTIIVGLVKEAIKLLEDKEKILIYCHPQDIETIKSRRNDFVELIDASDSLHILPDELLEPGECRLESKSEIIDTDINYQFGEIKKKLTSGD